MSFEPPAYPYDRLDEARGIGAAHEGGLVDLSVGTPGDPPPENVLAALNDGGDDHDGASRGYPASIGGVALRRAIQEWTRNRLGAEVSADSLAVCVGTKEFVATTPAWLKLRYPDRDTVLYPSVAYPTYEMGARLAGLRPVPVAVDSDWRIDLASVDDSDSKRALMLWVNSPANPSGTVDDLEAVARWGRDRGIPVFSDECYAEFTWDGPPRTVLGCGGGADGLEGVVAVHSLSKRSNMAGMRVGWYAGDPGLVAYLREIRKHAGFMVPGPVQRAAIVALGDQEHVEAQRARYRERLDFFGGVLSKLGASVVMPEGGFYLWVAAPDGDEWQWTRWLAEAAGVLVSPGTFYGQGGAGYVRAAMVAGMERLSLVAKRLGFS